MFGVAGCGCHWQSSGMSFWLPEFISSSSRQCPCQIEDARGLSFCARSAAL